jgi:hypothetical protein
MNDDNESKRRPDPSEALHHPARKPAAKDQKKKDVTEVDARGDDEHGGSERDTMTPGGPR